MRQAVVALVLVLAAGVPAAEAFRAPTCAPLAQTRVRGACGAAPKVCMRVSHSTAAQPQERAAAAGGAGARGGPAVVRACSSGIVRRHSDVVRVRALQALLRTAKPARHGLALRMADEAPSVDKYARPCAPQQRRDWWIARWSLRQLQTAGVHACPRACMGSLRACVQACGCVRYAPRALSAETAREPCVCTYARLHTRALSLSPSPHLSSSVYAFVHIHKCT